MGNMIDEKVSVCVTVYNESKETINKLLTALNRQTLKPNEIILIDASEKTQRFKKSKTLSNLKIINKTGISRSGGRNIAIKKAKNEIVAITDSGCIPHKDWLEKLTDPFKNENVDVVSGFYKMVSRNNFEKTEAVFLGVAQKDMNSDFMPSARSMAFTKTIWKKAGGFPENLNDTAEDNVFNLNLLKTGAKFVVAKNAIVDWYMPETIKNYYLKIKNYARGDAQSGIWWHPVKKWKTHNLKVMTIFVRYMLFVFVFVNLGYGYLGGIMGIYMLYAYKKASMWGIILQFISDFACIIGFSHGIFSYCIKRN